METKIHSQADKKLKGALSTFTNAVKEIDKAIELKEVSVKHDRVRMVQIENQIKALEQAHDQVIANILTKESEIKKHVELALKMKEFTL